MIEIKNVVIISSVMFIGYHYLKEFCTCWLVRILHSEVIILFYVYSEINNILEISQPCWMVSMYLIWLDGCPISPFSSWLRCLTIYYRSCFSMEFFRFGIYLVQFSNFVSWKSLSIHCAFSKQHCNTFKICSNGFKILMTWTMRKAHMGSR